jgi:hypothetical protein
VSQAASLKKSISIGAKGARGTAVFGIQSGLDTDEALIKSHQCPLVLARNSKDQ